MRKKTDRSEIVQIRLAPDTKRAAELVAQATSRTLSGLLDYALKRYIQKNFPEAYEPGARVVISLADAPTEE